MASAGRGRSIRTSRAWLRRGLLITDRIGNLGAGIKASASHWFFGDNVPAIAGSSDGTATTVGSGEDAQRAMSGVSDGTATTTLSAEDAMRAMSGSSDGVAETTGEGFDDGYIPPPPEATLIGRLGMTTPGITARLQLSVVGVRR